MLRLSCSDDLAQRGQQPLYFLDGVVVHEADAKETAEALDILRQQRVDLVLSDINMPVMDGLEFVKQIAGVENAKGVPVVMITTEGSESHVKKPRSPSLVASSSGVWPTIRMAKVEQRLSKRCGSVMP